MPPGSARRPAREGNGRRGTRRRQVSPRRSRPQHRVRSRAPDRDTLSGKASRALGWSFGSIVVNKFSLFGIGVLLARLLGPHAFGTYAVAYVAMTALLTFNELGVSLAIIR